MILLIIQGRFSTDQHYYCRLTSAPVEQCLISTAEQQGVQRYLRNILLVVVIPHQCNAVHIHVSQVPIREFRVCECRRSSITRIPYRRLLLVFLLRLIASRLYIITRQKFDAQFQDAYFFMQFAICEKVRSKIKKRI